MFTLDQIKNQQAIMKALGFYDGQLDGIWGPRTIEAKQRWEFSGKFAPAIPNRGLPFKAKDKLPGGIIRKGDLLSCAELVKMESKKQQANQEVPPTAKSKTVIDLAEDSGSDSSSEN